MLFRSLTLRTVKYDLRLTPPRPGRYAAPPALSAGSSLHQMAYSFLYHRIRSVSTPLPDSGRPERIIRERTAGRGLRFQTAVRQKSENGCLPPSGRISGFGRMLKKERKKGTMAEAGCGARQQAGRRGRASAGNEQKRREMNHE